MVAAAWPPGKRGRGTVGVRPCCSPHRQERGNGAKSGDTGERHLPERNHLTQMESAETTDGKRTDTKRGKQSSALPKAIARKTARDRPNLARADLMQRAARAGIAGRSRVTKHQLLEAPG